MDQLNLFGNISCHVCDQVIGPSHKNPFLIDGFLDGDTGDNVCWGCRDEHYKIKSSSDKKNLYSEVPITI